MMTKSNQNHNIWRRLLTTSLWPDPCLCVSTLHSISLISVLTLLLQKTVHYSALHQRADIMSAIFENPFESMLTLSAIHCKKNTSLQCEMWMYDKSHQPMLLSPSQLLPTNYLPPLFSAPLDHSGVVRRVVIVVGNLVTTMIIIILPSLSLSSGYNLWKLKTESGEDCVITVLHCLKIENKQLKM